MNRKYFSARLCAVILPTIIFLLSTAAVKAQTIVPDEQVIREMTAFARRSENTLELTRPRISRGDEIVKTPVFTVPEEVEKVSAAVSSLEHTAFDWLNQKRVAQGLAPLKWSDDVAKIARYHSEDMAHKNYFSHREPDGSMVNNRASLFGMDDWQSIGENIAFNRGFKLPAESACQQWMNSTGHRENILSDRWNAAGIGVAVAPDGTYYFTEVFVLR